MRKPRNKIFENIDNPNKEKYASNSVNTKEKSKDEKIKKKIKKSRNVQVIDDKDCIPIFEDGNEAKQFRKERRLTKIKPSIKNLYLNEIVIDKMKADYLKENNDDDDEEEEDIKSLK